MICPIAFGSSVLVGMEDDLVGIGLGIWVLGLLLFVYEAARTDPKDPNVASADIASLFFIAATFFGTTALDVIIRLATVSVVGLCELT